MLKTLDGCWVRSRSGPLGLMDDPKVLKTSCTEGLTDDPKVLKTSCTEGLTDNPKVLKIFCTEGLTDDPKVFLKTSCTEGLTDDPKVLKTSCTEGLTNDPKVLKTSCTKGLTDDPKISGQGNSFIVFKTFCMMSQDHLRPKLNGNTNEILDDFTDIDSSSDTEEILNSDSDEENKLLYLTKMGYSEAEASITMERCGPDSSIAELTDFIFAAQMAKAADALLSITKIIFPEYAIGSPYFYYENVELAPIGSAKLTERILKALEAYDDEPPSSVQKYVLDECRKWNLVWVERNKVVRLEPDEVEMIPGFPKNHILGGGSVRDMFPGDINVMSLFSGISDAKVAFYCLGIPLKTDA
ncbi:zinc finger family protein [Hibiscus syriacus]|uniref:Zinc finger family protein n=1 Tax=Hibiscus syriacus TaxID=106335 RepID=A0A6A2YV72_HIBSY|nr:zinc finger family protein [Hibiscus syriacus]